jgi:hypothetical protein
MHLGVIYLLLFYVRSSIDVVGFEVLTAMVHYATSRKVAGSIPDEIIGFFSVDLTLPVALCPWCRLSL